MHARSVPVILALAVAASVALAGCGSTAPATPTATSTATAPASSAPTASSPTASATPAPAPTATPGLDAEGCPLATEGSLALAVALDRRLAVNRGRMIRLTTATVAARNDTWAADDAIPQFVGLDLSARPLILGPAARLTVAGVGTMTMAGGEARAWPRDRVTGGEDGAEILVRGKPVGLATAVADGRLSIRLPGAGTWVVEILPRWQTDCLEGDGTAYNVVRVR